MSVKLQKSYLKVKADGHTVSACGGLRQTWLAKARQAVAYEAGSLDHSDGEMSHIPGRKVVKMKSPSIIRHLRANPNATEEELILKEEAAYFARCLLMPEDKVKELWENLNRFSSLSKFYSLYKKLTILATIFAVPKNEMRYRLYEIGLLKE